MNNEASSHCSMVMSMMTVLWNGDIALCCCDFNGDYLIGNIREKSIDTLWKSGQLSDYRGKALRRELEICKACPIIGTAKKIQLRPEPKRWENYC